jgi:glycosyltransferase involved in cell wall biosynthesis
MAENELLSHALASLQNANVELARKTDDLEQLRDANAALRAERQIFDDRLSAIETSLGWLLMMKLRNLRAKIVRPESLAGRCFTLFSRFLKTARAAGFRFAVRKARGRVIRRLGRIRWAPSAFRNRFFSGVFLHGARVDRFGELPWRYLGDESRSQAGTTGYLKVLLVSHSACRTGAPLCLLRLLEELTRLPDIECFVVLKQGGELADSFARLAPTLNLEWLLALGISRHEAPGLLASAFHAYGSRGVAVCNTLAVSEFHAAFREHQVDVLSWIHELPTFIGLLGGEHAIDEIKRGSRKIMVPSDAVRDALQSRFRIDADLIRTVYNGQEPLTQGLDRAALRLLVRRELGLPENASIVLGCGTIDLRKGADLFVNVARRILLEPAMAPLAPLTWFVWVGHGGEDNLRRWLLHDSRIGGLEERIRFIGPRSNVASYYMAADVLALTSREDPCPLVNMEAMESGLPVVGFAGAGGAPEVFADGGICVPYLDTVAMAGAVGRLLSDAAHAQEMGRRGRERIRARFTWNRFMDEFREILRSDFHHRPPQPLKVSVVVPNYRHAGYLEERIRSVFNQTLEPYEIIVLDDASPDLSVQVARRMASRAKVPMQIVVNEENSGSTFHQWLKGISLATGDLIWLAESDDSAHPLFLERLVPEFFDPDVVLAYCQSALIGPEGERLADDFLAHTDDISKSRWRAHYTAGAAVEAELALSQKNTIPNASAVVFRRPTFIDFAGELLKLKFAGDWLFYSMLIRGGKVSFIPEVLNFYRRHQATVSHRSFREDSQACESLYVKARIFETYPITPQAITLSLARSVLEYNQLTERMKLDRPGISANASLTGVLLRIRAELDSRLRDPAARRILMVLSDMKASAENIAVIDLANETARDHTVFLCNAQPSLLDSRLVERMDPRLIPLEGTIGEAFSTSERGLSAEAGGVAQRQREKVLKELIRILRIDLVHSYSPAADRLVRNAGLEQGVSWIVHQGEPSQPRAWQAATTPPDPPFARGGMERGPLRKWGSGV